MVRAILAGQKSQTRRVIDTQPNARGLWPRGTAPGPADCHYGKPGARLWVRETWRTAKSLNHLSPAQIEAQARDAGCTRGPFAPVLYVADGHALTADIPEGGWGKTRVSIHMPRWASRITLEVTEVRVQRLQGISEDDARAEGVGESAFVHEGNPEIWAEFGPERSGCSWAANPWVWAVSFKVVR
jgi:hypothetical protein